MQIRLLITVISAALVAACSNTSEKRAAPEVAPTQATAANSNTAAAAADSANHDGHGARNGHEGHKGDEGEKGSKGHFEHRFENASEWAKQFDDPKRDAWQKPARVVELLDITSGLTVADIGAGTGYFLASFSKAVGAKGRVLGLDVEADMVKHMSKRATKAGLTNVTARVVATDDPALEPGTIDRIVIVNTWHHIANRVAYTKKLAAALTATGTVAIIDYTKEAPRGPPAKHRLTPAEVIAELSAGGLRATAIEEDLPLQYIVVASASSSHTSALSPTDVPFAGARSFEGMLVGGHPSPDELRKAAAAGVKTVISLQTAGEPGVADEAALAAELKLNYVSIPIAGASDLTKDAATKLDAALKKAKASGPIIVHCGSGNRVGALFALRAHYVQGQSPADSIALGKAAGLTSLVSAVFKQIGAK